MQENLDHLSCMTGKVKNVFVCRQVGHMGLVFLDRTGNTAAKSVTPAKNGGDKWNDNM